MIIVFLYGIGGIASLSHLQQPLPLIATLSKSGIKAFVE